MKVLLLKDVYKLGNAGDVKRVAGGYARNYLIPQGLAVLATPKAIEQSESLRQVALEERARLNTELASTAEVIHDLMLYFPVRASEQGRLYGSITHQNIADAVMAEKGIRIDRRTLMHPPIKDLGVYAVPVRLTADLVPNLKVVVYPDNKTPDYVLNVEEPAEDEVEMVEAEAEMTEATELEAETPATEEA